MFSGMTVDILFKIIAMQLRITADDSHSVSYPALQQSSSEFLQKTLRIGTGGKDLPWNGEHQNPDSSFPVPVTQVSTEPGTRQAQSRKS